MIDPRTPPTDDGPVVSGAALRAFLDALGGGEVAVPRVAALADGRAEADLRVGALALRVTVRPIGDRQDESLGYLMRFVDVQVAALDARAPDAVAPPDAVLAVLRRMVARALPPLAAGVGEGEAASGAITGAARARAAQTVWELFGGAVWPGAGAVGGWRTRAAAFDGPRFVWTLVDAQGREAAAVVLADAWRDADPGPRALPAVEGPSARVFLRGAASSPAAGDEVALANLAAALRERVRLSGEIEDECIPVVPVERDASAGGGPDGPSDRGHGGEGGGLDARAGALRVTFRPRAGDGSTLVFFVAEAGPDDYVFQRVGATGIAHLPAPDDAAFHHAAEALVQAARSVGAPPGPGGVERWRTAIERALARTELARTHDWSVE